MIVGLVGRARSGKDTAARALTPEFTVKRLAQPVKDACKALYGWTDYALESDAKELRHDFWGVSPRQTMVHITQKLRDYMGPNFFTRRFFAEWDGKTPIVIPDVRYASDVDTIHQMGGVTIKIVRRGVPIHEFESEIPLLKTTWTVENNGTEEELHQKIKEVLNLKA